MSNSRNGQKRADTPQRLGCATPHRRAACTADSTAGCATGQLATLATLSPLQADAREKKEQIVNLRSELFRIVSAGRCVACPRNSDLERF